MKFLAIKSYWKHQHYHKRGAPWIKLHANVLSDAAFIQLPEVAQAQLMKLWSLASQLGHPLPNNPKLLAGKIGTTGKFHLPALIEAGFLVPCDTEEEAMLAAGVKSNKENASISLDESLHPSREEREERRETPHHHQHEPPIEEQHASIEAEVAGMLETDTARNALTAIVSKARNRYTCLLAFRSMLTGQDSATPQPTPADFGQALMDMAANDVVPSPRIMRGYLRDVRKEREERSKRGAPPFGAGARDVYGARRGNSSAPRVLPATEQFIGEEVA